MAVFSSADILLPRDAEPEKWAVIACDQFSAQPAYWQHARELAGDGPSALRLILPEAELSGAVEERIRTIHETMERYLREKVFRTYPDAFVYVERCLRDGAIRRGLVGKLDLERYDYRAEADSPVRATEKTVVERIPPRVHIREGAALELPHVILLCDDERRQLIEPLALQREAMPVLYDFDLMQQGGHIGGWLVEGLRARELRERLADYEGHTAQRFAGTGRAPLLYAVGDGNHSLAAARSCWEQIRGRLSEAERETHPARFALVELENLRDEAQVFLPIHRIVRHTDPAALLAAARAAIGAEEGAALRWVSGKESGTLNVKTEGMLPVAVLQDFLDRYLASNPGEIDYIHGDEALAELAREAGALGFLLPAMDKGELFPGIVAGGALPRKTFSMGHATEKRYYLEARAIR